MPLIDVSTDRLVCVEPIRPVPGWPSYSPPEADYANPAAQPIFGHPVRALTEGGPWRPDETPPILTKRKGTPRSRRIIIDAAGHTVAEEPPPEISNQRWTMQLARSMFRAGWTLDQADGAMWANRKTGGAYWQYRCDTERRDEDHPEHFTRQLWATLIETEKIKGMPIGVVGTEGRREFVWTVREKAMKDLVRWMWRHTKASQTELREARVVPPRMLTNYLNYMHLVGLIRPVSMVLPDRRGRLRRMKVWRPSDDELIFDKIEIFSDVA